MLQGLSRRRFSANLGILGIGEALTRLLTFIAFVHLARVLTPRWFGYVEVALAVLMVAMLLVDLGFPLYGTREISRNSDCTGALVPCLVSLQMALAVATYGLLALGVFLLPLDGSLSTLILALGVSLLGIPFLLIWVFQAQKRMIWVAVPQVARQLVFAVIVLMLVRSPGDLLRVSYAEIAAVAVAAVLCVAVYRSDGHALRADLRLAGTRRLFAASLPIGGAQFIWVLRMYLPIILLATMAEQSAVGRFGAAHRLMMVVQTLVGVYFINLFPTMSQTAQESKDALARLLHRSMSLLTWPIAIGAGATTLIAGPLIGFVFGEAYLHPQSVSVLAALIWVIPIMIWRRHLRCALIALDRQRTDFLCSLGGVMLLVVSLPLLTIPYGAVGTAWAMVASEAAAVGWTFACLRRHVPALSPVRSLVTFRAADAAAGADGDLAAARAGS